jgi:hypothetical protein
MSTAEGVKDALVVARDMGGAERAHCSSWTVNLAKQWRPLEDLAVRYILLLVIFTLGVGLDWHIIQLGILHKGGKK